MSVPNVSTKVTKRPPVFKETGSAFDATHMRVLVRRVRVCGPAGR